MTSDSPSLLLQEKPKQSRKTRTIEMHIIATDALADLFNTGASSDGKQYEKKTCEQESHTANH